MSNVSRRTFIKGSAGAAALVAAQLGAAQQSSEAGETNSALLAGVAAKDITPEPGVPMWGYSDREGPATGTLDPLWAKGLVLRAGGATVAVVTLDLGRVPVPAARDRIRERARKAGVDHVVLTATHTHQGPIMEAADAPHAQAIERAIGDCVEEALAKVKPVRIGIGRSEVDVAHNRRIILEDGRCLMLWRNEEKRPTSPVDKEMGIVRIDTAEGKPLAVLVNYACHPVVMGPSNRQYSGDYCGEMARIVKKKTGAECLFLQGACGNINPYLDKTPIEEGAVEAMRAVGSTCADTVLDAFDTIAPQAPESPSVSYVEKPVVVGARFDLSNDAQAEALRQVYGDALDVYWDRIKPDLAVPLGVLVLNNDLAFAFMPGEIFVQYQMELKANSPLPETFLCGYANEFHAYFPTVRDAAAGGYGGLAATYVGVGAGDKLVMEAAIEMGKLTGKLKSLYEPQDFALLESEEA